MRRGFLKACIPWITLCGAVTDVQYGRLISMKNESDTCLKHQWCYLSFYTMCDQRQGQRVIQTQTQQSAVNNRVLHPLSFWRSKEKRQGFTKKHGKMYVGHSQGSKKEKSDKFLLKKNSLHVKLSFVFFFFLLEVLAIEYLDLHMVHVDGLQFYIMGGTSLLLKGRSTECKKKGEKENLKNVLNSVGRKRPSLSYCHLKKGHCH